eukprot:c882_g1_i2.p2 GENE.c882_g1_i2~~c882_g1_i2.p2  ORF type:complete len:144 (-),score=16.73 c882_g1_i2:240-671(-)
MLFKHADIFTAKRAPTFATIGFLTLFLWSDFRFQLVMLAEPDLTFLYECAELFKSCFVASLPKLADAVSEERHSDVLSVAHYMASNAGTMGCAGLLKRCRKVEAAGRNRDLSGIASDVQAIEAEYKEVVAWLDAKGLLPAVKP